MKQDSASIKSQMFNSYHLALIGPPLIAIAVFCFGFVWAHQRAIAHISSAPPAKSAPSAIQPPSGLLLITQQDLGTLPPVVSSSGAQLSDPEDQVTPQLPAVASTNIQKADQRRQSAPDDTPNSLAPQLLLRELNSTINSSKNSD